MKTYPVDLHEILPVLRSSVFSIQTHIDSATDNPKQTLWFEKFHISLAFGHWQPFFSLPLPTYGLLSHPHTSLYHSPHSATQDKEIK